MPGNVKWTIDWVTSEPHGRFPRFHVQLTDEDGAPQEANLNIGQLVLLSLALGIPEPGALGEFAQKSISVPAGAGGQKALRAYLERVEASLFADPERMVSPAALAARVGKIVLVTDVQVAEPGLQTTVWLEIWCLAAEGRKRHPCLRPESLVAVVNWPMGERVTGRSVDVEWIHSARTGNVLAQSPGDGEAPQAQRIGKTLDLLVKKGHLPGVSPLTAVPLAVLSDRSPR